MAVLVAWHHGVRSVKRVLSGSFLQHPSMAIVKGAGLVMKAIIEVSCKLKASSSWMSSLSIDCVNISPCFSEFRRETRKLPLKCRSWPWVKGLSQDTCTPPCLPSVLTSGCWLTGPISKKQFPSITSLLLWIYLSRRICCLSDLLNVSCT